MLGLFLSICGMCICRLFLISFFLPLMGVLGEGELSCSVLANGMFVVLAFFLSCFSLFFGEFMQLFESLIVVDRSSSLELADDGIGLALATIFFKVSRSDLRSCRLLMIFGFFPSLFKRSAATDSSVRRIIGYCSNTVLKCSTDNE